MQPRELFAAFATRAHCWFMVNLFSTNSNTVLCKAAFQTVSHQPVRVHRLFLPRWKTLHFPFLNFLTTLSPHFSSLLRSFWMAGQLSGYNLLSPVLYHLPVCWGWSLVRSSRLLMKMLNYQPQGFSTSDEPFSAQQFCQFSIHLTAHLFKLYFISLSMRMLWEIVLKALVKPKQTSPTALPLSTKLVISSKKILSKGTCHNFP